MVATATLLGMWLPSAEVAAAPRQQRRRRDTSASEGVSLAMCIRNVLERIVVAKTMFFISVAWERKSVYTRCGMSNIQRSRARLLTSD